MEREYRIRKVEYPQLGQDFYTIQEKIKFLFFAWWSTKWESTGNTAFPLYFDTLEEAENCIQILSTNDGWEIGI